MIVAVAGGKGGVGKSTTALNLARELDAVAVDADLTTADLPPGTGPDLHDVLAGRVDPTAAVETIGPVTLLPCGRTLAGARAAARELDNLDAILQRIEREWGTVVVDCPAGLARDVGIELRSADLTILVTTPAKSALVDAFRTASLADALQTPIAALVLNKADRDSHGEIADKISRMLGVEVTIIASQQAVADAQARWLPVRDHAADAQAVDAYHSIADRLERTADRLSGRATTV
ncbi:MinD/ParA family ATP-binding protein [Natrialba asiatica]|uniref:Cobyrinic acid a,c-diamide synthase n=1 Tax=Natrialba asiatica (strain ATCC 700177 / DSM 12278 / JCM 9576 / FERM P-10747 / NBRC 102637 / 172P1) TaxID=29540 RepID=M0B5F0_NATA1|nr:AAA family ATPase [Natrialba asiatica]ELZ06136.1 cobyrinic acid a,c-diamide synthase [Natrialba asiatica DSM 12278]